MNASKLNDRLAVCSWSLQPGTPEELVSRLKATGINKVQIALDPLREAPAIWDRLPELFRQNNISIVSGMFGCVGEDYTTLESIRLTGGVAPDATWEQNLKNFEATAVLAKSLGLKLLTFHAGFLPHNETDPDYTKMLGRLREVDRIFSAESIPLAMETGQETAPDLLRVLQALNQRTGAGIGVNFDPANMILYAKGEPIEALRLLAPWVRQVHIKDATRTKVPGTWGEEVPAGTGEVNWSEFFATLKQFGFGGNLVIEREAGNQRVQDIQKAKAMVESLAA